MKKTISKKIVSVTLAMVMVFAMSATASASESVPVTGNIGIVTGSTPGTGNSTYSLTIPAAVNWYVTENSYSSTPNVWNTNGTTNTTNPNSIVNTNTVGAVYDVTLNSFTLVNAAATAVDPSLTLNLTGALATAPLTTTTDLSSGYTGSTAYTATLSAGTGNAWAFGFSGQYTGALSATTQTPTYTMTMSFALH